jgi:hypothetical protein
MSPFKHIRFHLPVLCLLALAFVLSGCREVKPFTWEPDFSINVAEVNFEWPETKEDLNPAELEVYERYGRPDFVHFIWSRRDHVVRRDEGLRIMSRSGQKVQDVKRGWIFLKDDREVVFKSPAHYELMPLNDKLRVIVDEGDPPPSWIKQIPNKMNKRIEKWQYVDRGIVYTFVDDELTNVDRNLTPLPGFSGAR